MGKISVIIPVYNTKDFLDECYASLCKQQYKNLEIIFIDNGSDDGSTEMLKTYADENERVKVYFFEENKGIATARNFGIQQATGEFLYFMDSDDVLEANTLKTLSVEIKDEEVIWGRTDYVHYVPTEESSVRESIPTVKLSANTLFRKISVLNGLIRKEAIEKYQLRFSEDVEYYSELTFIVSLIRQFKEISYSEKSVYYKRIRNDKITNPSFSQSNKTAVVKDFLSLYIQLKQENEKYADIDRFLDERFLPFYRKKMRHHFAKERTIKHVFDELVMAVQKLNINQGISWHIKREIDVLRKKNIKKYKKTLRNHGRARKLRAMMTGRTKFHLQMYRSVYLKMPVQENLIVFESFLGKNYSDSPKYIYEAIQKQGLDYECVWIFNETGKNIPGNAKQVKRFSKEYYYYLARAKYWVSNSRLPKSLNKRPENIYLQTWHGTPLKKLVFDMKDVLSANPNYKNDFYQQSRRWDYLIAANQYSSDIFKRAFKFEKEMLEFGYPRNDILHQKNNEKEIQALKKDLGLPLDKKVILYAPTWRDNEYHAQGKYKFDLKFNLEKMKEALGNEYIILLRMHYFISDNLDISNHKGFAYDYSKYDDIAELYLLSDILITDYSSVMFDYANTKRPILFYTYDLETYRDTLRGFYFDFEAEAPGPLLGKTEEIIQSIQNIESVNAQYAEKYQAFYETFCGWESGDATEKVIEKVFTQKP